MKYRSVATMAAVVAGLVLIAGFAVDARSTIAAYLVAWIAWGAIPIGALILFMTSYLVRRRWTVTLHPVFVAATGLLPVVALTFIPVLLLMKNIYPAIADGASLPPFKAHWFTPWFFVLRTVFYFAVWIGLSAWLRRSWRNDEAMVRAASAGAIVGVLLISFAGIDWVEFAGTRVSLVDLWPDLYQLHISERNSFRPGGRLVVDASHRAEPRL